MIHEGELDVGVADHGALEFRTRRGHALQPAPARIGPAEFDELERWLADVDLRLDPSVNFPRWDGSPLDRDSLDMGLTWLLSVTGQSGCASG